MRIRDERVRLKKEMARLEREMSRVRSEAEDRYRREEDVEHEEELARLAQGVPEIVAPSGLSFDFTGIPPSEEGGGPGTFWAGCFVDDNPVLVPSSQNV